MGDVTDLQKRCIIYAFLCGKQLGGIVAIRDMIDNLSIEQTKNALDDLIKESKAEEEKLFKASGFNRA